MNTQQSTNTRSLQARDRLPFEAKVVLYGRLQGHSGLSKMRPCKKIAAEDVHTDGQGNVSDMPRLIGRPCFAIPTGYLREQYAPLKRVEAMRTMAPTSKCNRCNVASACRKVVFERMRHVHSVTPSIASAMQEWKQAGGFKLYGFNVALSTLGEAAWRDIANEFQKVSFACSNDHAVKDYWDSENETYAKRRRSAAAKELNQDWREGRSLPILVAGLHQGRSERITLLQAALKSSGKPPYLVRTFDKDVERLAAAWWGREFAKFTGGKLNPHNIAGILIDENLNLGICKSSLRSTLLSDFTKIQKLQANAGYNKWVPIWSKFEHPALIL